MGDVISFEMLQKNSHSRKKNKKRTKNEKKIKNIFQRESLLELSEEVSSIIDLKIKIEEEKLNA